MSSHSAPCLHFHYNIRPMTEHRLSSFSFLKPCFLRLQRLFLYSCLLAVNACKGILVYIYFPCYALGNNWFYLILFCIDMFPPLPREPAVPYRTDRVHQRHAMCLGLTRIGSGISRSMSQLFAFHCKSKVTSCLKELRSEHVKAIIYCVIIAHFVNLQYEVCVKFSCESLHNIIHIFHLLHCSYLAPPPLAPLRCSHDSNLLATCLAPSVL